MIVLLYIDLEVKEIQKCSCKIPIRNGIGISVRYYKTGGEYGRASDTLTVLI